MSPYRSLPAEKARLSRFPRYVGSNPISDPDLPADQQPMLRGLALPDEVLQKLYHDNATKFLSRLGAGFPSQEASVRAA